jgi:peroxiredoxin family protein
LQPKINIAGNVLLPITITEAPVVEQRKQREVTVFTTTSGLQEVRRGSLDLQLKSGRSLFQSNPAAVRMMDVQTILANDTRSGEAMILTVPAHPHLETDDDELEEDMPVIVTPKLMMRPKSAT